MNDLLGEDARRYESFITKVTAIVKKYGYEFIQTPHLEETALFKRSVGESSDIVGKEMYQFIDKGENDVCLRPEGTAGVVRSFIQKKFDKAGGKYKFFYHGSMFRYERPQKGRMRTFSQFGCESFGESSMYEDATIIIMIKEIFDSLGIEYKILLNSLGCKACMPTYKETLIKSFEPFKEQLCEDCQRRIITNPIRVLDCKVESCQALLVDSPKITHSLCDECDSDFEKLKSLLDQNGIEYEIDSSLVRGLDYYSKTAFEFVSDALGAQSAIAGGGRYDRLVEFLDGKPTPAIGFAIGIDRILELIPLDESKREGIYFGALDEESLDPLFGAMNAKAKSERVMMEYKPKKMIKHLQSADKANARYCAIIGEDERKNNTIWIKDLESKDEKVVGLGAF
jgi:histidyl-tRNA synthetase